MQVMSKNQPKRFGIRSLLTIFFVLFLSATASAGDVSCINLPEWDPKATYLGGDQVQYKSIAYEAKWWTQGDNPAEHSSNWAVWTNLGACQPMNPVVITYPANGTQFNNFELIPVYVDIPYIDTVIDRVEFYANGIKYGEDKTAPYEIHDLIPVSHGDVELVAKAVTPSGLMIVSDPVHINLIGLEMPRIIIPAKEYVVQQENEIIPEGDMNAFYQVKFYINGTLIGTDTNYPFSATWVPPYAGSYVLTVEGFMSENQTVKEFANVDVLASPCGAEPQLAECGIY